MICVLPVVPHEVVPEVSKGKVNINQKKHVPIVIDCKFLNTFHSILFWWWLERLSKKNYSVSVLQSATKYYKVVLQYNKVLLQ